jgi:hypothetical protein
MGLQRHLLRQDSVELETPGDRATGGELKIGRAARSAEHARSGAIIGRANAATAKT